jgi:iron uptake system component EfeO
MHARTENRKGGTSMKKTILIVLALGLLAACSSSKKAAVTVPVQAKEYAFEPATLSVAAGRVSFEVKNVGKEEHEFEIFQGATLIDEVEEITPGLTRTLTVDLKAGTYTYVCKEPGHEEKGQKGTLTVS